MTTQEEAKKDELTLSTGVVLRVTTPSVWAITNVVRQLRAQEPKAPMIYIEDKDRSEPNNADPAYIQAIKDFDLLLDERILEVAIASGTEVVSVPEGFSPYTDDAWREKLKAGGVELSKPEESERRYIEWVKLWACRGNQDWIALAYPILRKTGTREEDVTAAVETFRGVPERNADSGNAPA